MIVVALYARVGTESQNTDNQILRLKQIAEARGYVIFKTYIDVASGANAKRPQLVQMMHDAQCHLFEKIMCVKIDRLARSIINLLPRTENPLLFVYGRDSMTMIPKVCVNCQNLKDDGSCKIRTFLIPVLYPDFKVRSDLEVVE